MKIECADFKDHEDEGRWRSYDLEAEGDTLEQLLAGAIYWQTDQDGGSLGEVEADDDKAVEYITAEFEARTVLAAGAARDRAIDQGIDEAKERKGGAR